MRSRHEAIYPGRVYPRAQHRESRLETEHTGTVTIPHTNGQNKRRREKIYGYEALYPCIDRLWGGGGRQYLQAGEDGQVFGTSSFQRANPGSGRT